MNQPDTISRRAPLPLGVRVLITLGLLFLGRLVMILPVFGTRLQILGIHQRDNGIPGMFTVPGTEHIVAFGVLGIATYISACLLAQVAVPVVPPLRELAREGRDQTIRWIIWCLTILFSWISLHALFRGLHPDTFAIPQLAAVQMVLGVFLLVGIGHGITKWGVGNGIALILAAQTIAPLADAILQYGELLGVLKPDPWLPGQPGLGPRPTLFQLTVLFPGASLIALVACVSFLSTQRRLSVTYEDGERPAVFPVPLWCAGILPLIAAQSWLVILPNLLRPLDQRWNIIPAGKLLNWLHLDSPGNYLFYAILLVLFSIWWSRRLFDHTHIANTLAEQGGRIEGVAPGPETALFLRRCMTRLSVSGGVFLMVICVLPLFLNFNANIPFALAQFGGGLSMVILTAVLLDTYKQLVAGSRDAYGTLRVF